MGRIKGSWIVFCLAWTYVTCSDSMMDYQVEDLEENPKSREMFQADPTIFSEEGKYYLYGTNDEAPDHGFQVFTSENMKTWWGPEGVHGGYALDKGRNFGNSGFWAPQVWKYQDQYYMAYTADENIAISVSNDPLGPFESQTMKPVFGSGNQIDPFVFIDEDDKKYLFFVRLINGNRIYMAEMEDDFMSVKEETISECISATEPWENTDKAAWPVAEGPTVLKHNDYYYLIYCANDFRNPNYAVGYAIASDINGPWEKFSGNPVLNIDDTGWAGGGHGDITFDEDGNMFYVFHTHNQDHPVPRKTAIVEVEFDSSEKGADRLVFKGDTFYHLNSKK